MAALSYALPGLGHLVLGRRRAAAVFVVPALLAGVWLAVQLGQGLAWFGASFLDDTFMATFVAIAGVLGVWRIAAMTHAYFIAGSGVPKRTIEIVVLVALAITIVGTHAAAMAGAWSVYEVGAAANATGSNNWLDDSNLADPSFTPDMSTPTPYVDPTWNPAWSFNPGATSGPSRTPAPTPWVNPDRITFLLIGVDFMTGRHHALTDTMMLATLDVHTNKATMISIPRDSAAFELYYGGFVGQTFKLNSLMSAAANKKFGSPDTGVETLKKEIGFLTGLPVDYYAAVDLDGFVKVVEALGGVDIDVKTAVNDPFTGTFVSVGKQHFDGHQALKYARSREGSSDYARAARQQEILTALARKVVTPDVIPLLPELFTFVGDAVKTDFPMKYARNFITAFRRVKEPYKCVLSSPYSYHPDTATTGGTWTSRLDIARVANLSVWLFGRESTYYNRPGVVPAPCGQ